MELLERLAQHALHEHPDRATTVLERLDEPQTIELLARGPVASAAAIVQRLSPHYAAAVLQGVTPERGAEILAALPLEVAARLLRRTEAELRENLLGRLDRTPARSLRSVLRFRPGSVGAVMDPDVLALPRELSAGDALERVRRTPKLARYNLYVVDQSDRLVGALNLRELLLGREGSLLGDLMTRDPHRVRATMERHALLGHPGWKEVHALPVVDEDDAFLGVIRYRVLRQLEEELVSGRGGDVEAAHAFGQVIAAGARGVLDAVSGAARPTGREAHASDDDS